MVPSRKRTCKPARFRFRPLFPFRKSFKRVPPCFLPVSLLHSRPSSLSRALRELPLTAHLVLHVAVRCAPWFFFFISLREVLRFSRENETQHPQDSPRVDPFFPPSPRRFLRECRNTRVVNGVIAAAGRRSGHRLHSVSEANLFLNSAR